MLLQQYWDKSHKGLKGDIEPSKYGLSVVKLFPQNSFVLDLGGGRGRDSFLFLQKGHQVVLLDISPCALNQAKETASRLGFVLSTVKNNIGQELFPFEDNTFDVVYSHLSLHYANRENTLSALLEVNRILKPDGKFFATVKSTEDKEDMEKVKAVSAQIEPGFFMDKEGIRRQSRYTIDSWTQMLKKAGFRRVSIKLIDENVSRKETGKETESKKLLVNEIRTEK